MSPPILETENDASLYMAQDHDEAQQQHPHDKDTTMIMKLAALAPHHYDLQEEQQEQENEVKAPFDEDVPYDELQAVEWTDPPNYKKQEETEDDAAQAVEWTLTAADLKQKDDKQTTTIIGTIELAHKESVVKETIAGNAKIVNQRSVLDDDDDDDDASSEDDDDELLGLDHSTDESFGLIPGVLPNGMAYTPTQIIVQGWLYKKGTGQDWFKSRAWKARWGRLVWAKLDDTAIEVPLLLMYWYPSSQKASTAVVLNKTTVVVAVDFKPKPTAWNAHRLEIRHLSTDESSHDKEPSRTFAAANRQERNAWIYAMAQALLDYSKSKQVHDRAVRSVSPPSCRRKEEATIARSPRSLVPLDLPKSPRSSSVPRKIVVEY